MTVLRFFFGTCIRKLILRMRPRMQIEESKKEYLYSSWITAFHGGSFFTSVNKTPCRNRASHINIPHFLNFGMLMSSLIIFCISKNRVPHQISLIFLDIPRSHKLLFCGYALEWSLTPDYRLYASPKLRYPGHLKSRSESRKSTQKFLSIILQSSR